MDCPICEGPVDVNFEMDEAGPGAMQYPVITEINRECDCIWSDEVQEKFDKDALESAMDYEPYGDY